MKRYLPFIIIAIVLVATVGVSWIILRGGTSDSNSNATFATANSSAPNNPAVAVTDQPSPNSQATQSKAKVGSPIVIEEYGDYQCPPCGQLYPELKQIEHEFGDKVQVVFRHFPLTKIHKNALLAAHAAEAARNQNKFWEMHDKLYRNQKEWSELADSRTVFTSYARQLNLNIEQFASDLQSNLIAQRIAADSQRGNAAGVTGTPTVFLNGNLLRYEATNLEGLRRALNILLERGAAPGGR